MITTRISRIGLYDKQKAYATTKTSPLREVEYFEIEYIINCDSDTVMYIDSESYSISPNTVIIRKPAQTSRSKSYFTCYFMHFALDKSSKYYDILINLPSIYSIINVDKYRGVFESIFRHSIKTSDKGDDYILAKLLELVYYLKKDATRNHKVIISQPPRQIEYLQKAIAYMKENFNLNLNLNKLSEISGYTPNHFRQIFTQSMGVSPQKYLEDLRIQHAKYLLTRRDLTIAEVAYECGFSSQSYFSTLFKKYTLITPHEFRLSVSADYPDESI